jgi:hypothetical protein
MRSWSGREIAKRLRDTTAKAVVADYFGTCENAQGIIGWDTITSHAGRTKLAHHF